MAILAEVPNNGRGRLDLTAGYIARFEAIITAEIARQQEAGGPLEPLDVLKLGRWIERLWRVTGQSQAIGAVAVGFRAMAEAAAEPGADGAEAWAFAAGYALAMLEAAELHQRHAIPSLATLRPASLEDPRAGG